MDQGPPRTSLAKATIRDAFATADIELGGELAHVGTAIMSSEPASGNANDSAPVGFGTPFQVGPFRAMAGYNWELHRGAELAQGRGVYGSTWRWRHQNRTGTWKDTPNHQQFDEAGILSGDGPGGDGGGAQRDIRALFRDELLNNLEVLKEIRDDRNELASPRIMSIREINDRALGGPVQPNGSADAFVPSANPVEEVERLEREVEQLSAKRELPPANASE